MRVVLDLLSELSRVLRYPRVHRMHGMTEQEIDAYVRDLQAASLMVDVLSSRKDAVVPSDPQDDPIVATAVAAKAEALCTRDKHLHHESVIVYCSERGIEVVTDLELLQRLRTVQS